MPIRTNDLVQYLLEEFHEPGERFVVERFSTHRVYNISLYFVQYPYDSVTKSIMLPFNVTSNITEDVVLSMIRRKIEEMRCEVQEMYERRIRAAAEANRHMRGIMSWTSTSYPMHTSVEIPFNDIQWTLAPNSNNFRDEWEM